MTSLQASRAIDDVTSFSTAGATGSHKWAHSWSFLIVAVGLGFVVWGAVWIGNFIEDDTLISLRYAQRLLAGEGLTWTNGERVEGYSNLLWVLLNAFLGLLGLDLILAARILTFASIGVSFWCLALAGRALRLPGGAVLGVGAVLGATASLPVWAMGALEQPLVGACLAGASVTLIDLRERLREGRRLRTAVLGMAAALTLLVWTRPDSPLFVAVYSIGAAALARRAKRGVTGAKVFAAVAGIPFAGFALQLAFRRTYYGQWVPNTAHVKARFTAARLEEGLQYVMDGFQVTWLIGVMGVVGLLIALISERTRGVAVVIAIAAFFWLAYVACIGGDHFPGYRHLLPVHVLCAFLGVLGARAAVSRLGPKRKPQLVVAAVTALLMAGAPFYLISQRTHPRISVARGARWQWDGKALGHTLKSAFKEEQPLWAVTAAGCMPYFSGFPALDMLGLNDAHIAGVSPDPHLPLAHQHGDGRYVLRRKPDLITFGLPTGSKPIYKSGHEMDRERQFRRDYQPVTFQTYEPHVMESLSYVRKFGRVGIEELEQGGFRIPGYMLRGKVRAVPNLDGDLVGELRGQTTMELTLQNLPAGRYDLDVIPENPLLQVRVQSLGKKRGLRAVTGSAARFQLDLASSLRLQVRSPLLTTRVEELVLHQLAGSSPGEGRVVRQIELQEPRSVGHLRKAQKKRLFPSGTSFGEWTVQGEAFGSARTKKRRLGQGVIEKKRGPFVNSFRMTAPDVLGDVAEGTLTSPALSVSEGDWLSFRVGGGEGTHFGQQVGVAILSEGRVWAAFTGRRDERLRQVRVDLSPLAGSQIRIQIYDHSDETWGHVIADQFVLRSL